MHCCVQRAKRNRESLGEESRIVLVERREGARAHSRPALLYASQLTCRSNRQGVEPKPLVAEELAARAGVPRESVGEREPERRTARRQSEGRKKRLRAEKVGASFHRNEVFLLVPLPPEPPHGTFSASLEAFKRTETQLAVVALK